MSAQQEDTRARRWAAIYQRSTYSVRSRTDIDVRKVRNAIVIAIYLPHQCRPLLFIKTIELSLLLLVLAANNGQWAIENAV